MVRMWDQGCFYKVSLYTPAQGLLPKYHCPMTTGEATGHASPLISCHQAWHWHYASCHVQNPSSLTTVSLSLSLCLSLSRSLSVSLSLSPPSDKSREDKLSCDETLGSSRFIAGFFLFPKVSTQRTQMTLEVLFTYNMSYCW